MLKVAEYECRAIGEGDCQVIAGRPHGLVEPLDAARVLRHDLGFELPDRSRGTCSETGPTSVSTVFGERPLR
jgi:hypothetical protein